MAHWVDHGKAKVEVVLVGDPALAGTTIDVSRGRPRIVTAEEAEHAPPTQLVLSRERPTAWWKMIEEIDSAEIAEEIVALRGTPDLVAVLRKWPAIAENREHSISKFRSFDELKAIYDGRVVWADTEWSVADLPIRALDAMCEARYPEAVPIERAVLRDGRDLDRLPAALRCAVALDDRAAVPLIAPLYAAVNADTERRSQEWETADAPDANISKDEYEGLLNRRLRDHATGRLGGSGFVLDAFACLASADDRSVALDLLRKSDFVTPLVGIYFAAYPGPEVLPILRQRARGKYDSNIGSALIVLGDPDAVAWARKQVDSPLAADLLERPQPHRSPGEKCRGL